MENNNFQFQGSQKDQWDGVPRSNFGEGIMGDELRKVHDEFQLKDKSGQQFPRKYFWVRFFTSDYYSF